MLSKFFYLLIGLCLTFHCIADENEPNMSKLSEALGHFIGRNLKVPGVNFDIEMVIKGIRDGAAGKEPPMSDQEYEELMLKYQEKAMEEIAVENLKKANEFMSKNASEPNIIELEKGKLQYLVLNEGKGDEIDEKSTPLIHYKGKFLDGTVFGSSEEAGGPIAIPMAQTIPGFSKGMIGMKEGEKRRLFVHPDLGYGTSGSLPPNSLLIFDIEVIKADDDEDEDLLPLSANDNDLEAIIHHSVE